MRKISPTVIGGNASTTRNCTTRVIQTKTGIRMSVMPGARMLRIVTMKFTPAITEDAPSSCRLSSQKSIESPGENWRDVRFA